MVWKSFKLINKKPKIKILENLIPEKKEEVRSYKMFLTDQLFKKSGMIHGINSVTGKKVKTAFVDGELKKTYIFPKKKFFSKNKEHNGQFIQKLLLKKVTSIKDSDKLSAKSSDKKNLFISDRFFADTKKNKFMPNIYNKKWISMHSGTLIDKRQETYLQSKKDIRWDDFKKQLKNFKESVSNVTNNLIWLDTFYEKMQNAPVKHDSGDFNSFIRFFTYRNLLFRSFWFSKLVSTVVKWGKKIRVWNYVLRGFGILKAEFGRSPVVLLFEILELYRMPIKGLVPKSTTRKSIVRTHLVPWWKQYTQTLRWIRHSILGGVKNHESWNQRIKTEFLNIMMENANSLIKKRIEANFQLIAFGKIAIHFRWYKRYSKRTVKSIRILDRKLYLKG